MRVGYCYDPIFLEHDHPGHPENAQRLRAVMALLRHENILDELVHIPIQPTTDKDLQLVHRHDYISEVMSIAGFGGGQLGADTYLNDASYDAAAMAAGAAMAATHAVLNNIVQRSISLVRPPGHHAFATHGEGFCLFNNVAFAAKTALNTGLDRVMIVDFDVHHGNGTQAIFYDDPRVLFVSSHQMPLYPGSGHVTETGKGAGAGTTINVPLLPYADDVVFAKVIDEIFAPAAQKFKPQLLLLSAGFDAHWRDPLAQLCFSLAGFADGVRALLHIADEHCAGKAVVMLEGGYDLDALSYGVLNTIRLLQNKPEHTQDPVGADPSRPNAPDMRAVFGAVRALHGLA